LVIIMDGGDWLTKRFDETRAHLRAIAHRMLGSASEAEDALQEAWLKLNRSDAREVENVGGWLTTVVARVCLDMLRARRSRREEPLAPAMDAPGGSTPESEVGLADAIGPALLVVLDMLAPQERVAFVLHDMFDLSFDEIAPIIERTPAAARQLASRARRRVQGTPEPAPDVARRHDLVRTFLAAARDGDFEGLVAVLSPDAVLHADELSVRMSKANQRHRAPALAPEVRGADRVAGAFNGRAHGVSSALIDGAPGAAWVMAGQVRAAWLFTVEGGRIAAIDVIMDPARLAELDVRVAIV
jgi:RNA polymerase sigma-70 factor (ECF subfamily)